MEASLAKMLHVQGVRGSGCYGGHYESKLKCFLYTSRGIEKEMKEFVQCKNNGFIWDQGCIQFQVSLDGGDAWRSGVSHVENWLFDGRPHLP